MKRKETTILFVLLTCAGLSSCLHVGMMGTGDAHHAGARHEMVGDTVVEKEVTVGNVRAIASFPSFKLGERVTLTLRLLEARTAAPISGAQVYLHVQYAHRASHDDHGEGPPRTKERDYDIDIGEQVMESSEPGVYAVNYASEQAGDHTLMFHVTGIGDRRHDPEITVGATRTLLEERHGHQSGMMGGTGTTTYVIIGAAVMGAFMVAMLAVRGGLF